MQLPPWRTIALGFLFAALGLFACAPTDSPSTSESGRAAVVIVPADRSTRTECVDFKGTEVTGRKLVELAGIPMTLDERNAMGALVCAVGGQGCAYPAEPCLCQCEGLGDCAYWASFVRTPPGSWTYAGQGISTQPLHSGDLYAWVWLPTASSSEALGWLPEGDLESICP